MPRNNNARIKNPQTMHPGAVLITMLTIVSPGESETLLSPQQRSLENEKKVNVGRRTR